MTRPDYKNITRAILVDQRRGVDAFIDEWTTQMNSGTSVWMTKIDSSVRVLADAYSFELLRLINGDAGSQEWAEILEYAGLLRAATFDKLRKVQPQLQASQTSLPISGPGPKTIADKTYAFLVGAAYQFGSSLGELRKHFPADVRIVAG